MKRITRIVFHGSDKDRLLQQIGSSGFEIDKDVQVIVLDTPKSTARSIMESSGYSGCGISDLNALIQEIGNTCSQDWIEFVFSQAEMPLWNAFTISNTCVRPFQYSTLLNRNREASNLYDDIIRMIAVNQSVHDKGNCLVVSDDPTFLISCRELGFRVAGRNLRWRLFLANAAGFLRGIARRAYYGLSLGIVNAVTRNHNQEILDACSRPGKASWLCATFLPRLVSRQTGHDDRYRPVVKNIEESTASEIVYAGWPVISYNELKQLGKDLSQEALWKKPRALMVSHTLGIKDLLSFVFPSEMMQILRNYLRNKRDLDQNFYDIPLKHALRREFFKTYFGTGDSSESFYHYRLVENAYLRVCKAIRPAFATTFLEGYNFGRSVIAAARAAGIPVFGWQESVLHPMRLYYRWSRKSLDRELGSSDTRATYLYPDAFAVWSEDTRAFLMEQGMDERFVIVTGAARYHEFLSRLKTPKAKDPNNGEVHVLLVGTAFLQESIAMVDFIQEALSGAEKIKVSFRPHPQTKPYFTSNPISGGITVSEKSLNDDLEWADVILSSWSTMLCEAYLMGKRCISIFCAGWVSQPPLSGEFCDYCMYPSDLRTLLDRTDTLRSDEERSLLGKRLLGSTDVNSGTVMNDFLIDHHKTGRT